MTEQRKLKAQPFEVVQHTDDPGSPYDSTYSETRWRLVDETTGEIVDDAQGYGYKSAQGAHRAHGFKAAHPSKKKRNNVHRRVEPAGSQPSTIRRVRGRK